MEVKKIWNKEPGNDIYETCYDYYTGRAKGRLPDEVICTNIHLSDRVIGYWLSWHQKNYVSLCIDIPMLISNSSGKSVCLYLSNTAKDLCILGEKQAVREYMKILSDQMEYLEEDVKNVKSAVTDVLTRF